jgi:flagellar hook assembly protein FlgD
MAPARVHLETRQYMSGHHHTGQPVRADGAARRRDVLRLLAIVLSVLGLLLTSSALNLVTPVRAADEPQKAVIVAGPVHSQTDKYKRYCKAIANAAEAQGMDVVRIFHPYAPAAKVRSKGQGAHLFVYCGHGNGWPSAYGPFQENTKNGLGLDVADPEKRSPNNVVYKGADWLRENLELAPNAVVVLSHLSYASGNASSGMPIPSRDVARQRVDNFANGFLSIGARAVWALGWQPGADIVDALHVEDATMEAVFMTRYRDDVNPRNGWIGWQPGTYESERIPGATVYIDPDPSHGYLRGLTGDLAFTTTEWREAGARPPDTTAPVLSSVKARFDTRTISGSSVPVFTPNGDGLSDSAAIGFELSEGAFLEVKVKRDGSLVRRFSTWAQAGSGTVRWDGRKDNGKAAAEGTFNVFLKATDRAGNVSDARSTKVKLLDTVRRPTAEPGLFWAKDGDALAPSSVIKAKLRREATVSLVIRDRGGKVVRRAIDAEVRSPGTVRYAWDGKNDAGTYVGDDLFTARVTVKRPAGSLAHEVGLRHMPFTAWTRSWTRARGDTITLKLTAAEAQSGKPEVTANQKGIDRYTVPARKITRVSSTQFRVVIATKAESRAGAMKVRVKGTDKDGGLNSKVFTIRLK